MEYKKCLNCQSSIIFQKSFIITTLTGCEMDIDGELYCGKDCFFSYNSISSKSDTSLYNEKNSYLSMLIKEEMKLKTT